MDVLNKINFILNEASIPKRAWNSKLKNIDSLIGWMYTKGILTKTERDKKDRVFRQYYRYYNDGDFPRGISRALGVSVYSPKEKIEEALEQYLETFIKEMLSKYWDKVDRTDFRLDQLKEKYQDVLRQLEDENYLSETGLKYWLSKVSKNDTTSEMFASAENVINLMSVLSKKFNTKDNKESKNKVLGYQYITLKKANQLTKEEEAEYQEMLKQAKIAAVYVKDLIYAIERLQTMNGLK